MILLQEGSPHRCSSTSSSPSSRHDHLLVLFLHLLFRVAVCYNRRSCEICQPIATPHSRFTATTAAGEQAKRSSIVALLLLSHTLLLPFHISYPSVYISALYVHAVLHILDAPEDSCRKKQNLALQFCQQCFKLYLNAENVVDFRVNLMLNMSQFHACDGGGRPVDKI